MKRKNAMIVYTALFVAILALDLWSKAAVFELLSVATHREEGMPPRVISNHEYVIFPSWLKLEATLNPGGFNGWFAGNMWFLIPVSTLAVVGTGLFVWFSAYGQRIWVICLGLIAGGAAGNLYDRATEGAVRDFIAVFYRGAERLHQWPNFNVADSALCVGFGVLLAVELFGRKKPPEEAETAAAAASTDSPKPT